MYCPSCGKQIADDASFCGSCGAQIGGAAQAPQQPPAEQAPPHTPPPQYPQQQPGYYPEQPRRGGTCWIIGCIVLVLVLLVGGVGTYFVVRNMKDGKFDWSWQWQPGGQQMSADEQAVREVVEDFYAAWAKGDLDRAHALSTDNYAAQVTQETLGSGYTQHSLTIVEANQIDEEHWQVVADEVFDNTDGGRNTDRSTIDLVLLNGTWLVDGWETVVLEATTGAEGVGRQDEMSMGRFSSDPAGGPTAADFGGPGGDAGGASDESGGTSGGSASGGESGGGQSAGALPSPMQTLNDFLAAAGGSDGSKLLPFMIDQLKSEFSVTAQIWGQGDFEHVGWNVTSQNRVSETQWNFEVKETCRDWADGSLFYDTRLIDMTWNGSQWQVSRFDLVSR